MHNRVCVLLNEFIFWLSYTHLRDIPFDGLRVLSLVSTFICLSIRYKYYPSVTTILLFGIESFTETPVVV